MDLGVGCDPDDDDASCAPVAFGDHQPDDVALMDNGDEDGVRNARRSVVDSETICSVGLENALLFCIL